MRASKDFNPRSREGSDAGLGIKTIWTSISIHAPARGATFRCPAAAMPMLFQSTLPRGERPYHAADFIYFLYFNPRSREGSDHGRTCKGGWRDYFNPRSREGSDSFPLIFRISHPISIHAPARGATTHQQIGKISVFIFQSTLPRGERPTWTLPAQSFRAYFNPRSREGSDSLAASIFSTCSLFQSTLPRGERHTSQLFCRPQCLISIHAPARGATLLPQCFFQHRRFQSTLPRGERPGCALTAIWQRLFQSTLPRGERPRYSQQCS